MHFRLVPAVTRVTRHELAQSTVLYFELYTGRAAVPVDYKFCERNVGKALLLLVPQDNKNSLLMIVFRCRAQSTIETA